MYSLQDRKRAVELYIEYGFSTADTIRKLGYPNRNSLRMWYKEFVESGEIHDGYRKVGSKYRDAQKKGAVDHYLRHGARCHEPCAHWDTRPSRHSEHGLMSLPPVSARYSPT